MHGATPFADGEFRTGYKCTGDAIVPLWCERYSYGVMNVCSGIQWNGVREPRVSEIFGVAREARKRDLVNGPALHFSWNMNREACVKVFALSMGRSR